MNKLKAVIFFIIIFHFSFFIFHFRPVRAVNMDSNRYQIQSGSVDIGAGKTNSDNFKLSSTLGQLAAGQFQSDGFIVKAGFEYIHSIIPFTFSISDTSIDFPPLEAGAPKLAITDLTVSFGAKGQYQVTAGELGPLRNSDDIAIPDTACDGGSNICSETAAKKWTSNSAYGFGYSLKGDDIPSDFKDESYFRPFADLNAGKKPITIMSNDNVQKSRQSTVVFKTNISALQTTGTYQTIINFVATPSF